MSITSVSKARVWVEQNKGKRTALQKEIRSLKTTVKENKLLLENLEQAKEIIRLVGLETQKALQFHISDIASLALDGIFNEPYKLQLDFVERRGKTECDILFERDGKYFSPLSSSGGGASDIASFALRIASWSMSPKRKRNVIILDEPLRFLSENYQENASEMIKEISDKLGIQFIIVTHNPILASKADKTFEVKIRKGVSYVKET